MSGEVVPRDLSVGILFDGYLRPSEGVPAYITDVGGYMADQGHTVTYCVGGSDEISDNIIRFGETAKSGANGNRVERARRISADRAEEILKEMQPDVLHLQMPHHPLASGRVVRRAIENVPVIGTFHVLPNSRGVSLAMRGLAKVTARTNRRLDTMISNSEATQSFLHTVFGLDSVLIPNPVDVARFQTGRKIEEYNDGKINVVFLGRLVERKGAKYLVEAVGALDEKAKANARLLIAGTGELEAELHTQLAQLGLERNAELLGYISEKDKPDLLATADLAVFPASGGESFGIVLAEAMAAGAGVVVGGNNPGYSSVLGKTPEALVDPKDIAGFSGRLKWLIEHEEERGKLHAVQQDVVKAFDITVVGKAIEEIYQESLAR